MNENKQTEPVLISITFAFLDKNQEGKPQLRMFTSKKPGIGFGMFGVGMITDSNFMNPPCILKPNDTIHRYATSLFGKLKADTNFDGLFWKIMCENIFCVIFEFDNGAFSAYHPIFSGSNGFEDNEYQSAKMLDDGSLFFGISDSKTLDEMLDIYEKNLAPKFEGNETEDVKGD